MDADNWIDLEVGPYEDDVHRNELRLLKWFRQKGYPCLWPSGEVSRKQAEDLGLFLGGRYDKKATGIFNLSSYRIHTELNDRDLIEFRRRMIELAKGGPLTLAIEEEVAAMLEAEEASLAEANPVETTDSAIDTSNVAGDETITTGEPSLVADDEFNGAVAAPAIPGPASEVPDEFNGAVAAPDWSAHARKKQKKEGQIVIIQGQKFIKKRKGYHHIPE